MSDNELRDRIKRLVDETDDGDSAAKAIIDDLGLIVVDVPGGISDYSPSTGNPVVQPDRWYVDGERIFERRADRIEAGEA